MNYTCPKCGKKIEISTEALQSANYRVVCPQCLSQLQVVGDYAYVPLEDDSLALPNATQPSQPVICPKCGKQASGNAHFCPNCGTSFDAPSSRTFNLTPEEVTVLPPPIPTTGTVDPLYQAALKYLSICSAITPMMLRDYFGISDERAAELIRQLESSGAIGPYNGGAPRQILIPHSSTFGFQDSTQRYDADQLQQQMEAQRTPSRSRGCGSCISWFIVIAFAIYLFKSCTGA